MMRITLDKALEQLQSSRAKERDEAVKDLKHILSQNHRSSKLDVLTDKSYHQLFENLFRISYTEKSNYAKVGKPRIQATSKLAGYASTLRTAVEAGVRTVRHRTVKALTDHITQILPSQEETFCEPLANNYVRALRILLEYQPHTEHLLAKDWCALADFCIDGIRSYIASLDESSASTFSVLNSSNRLTGRLSRSATPSTLGTSSNQAQRFSHHSNKNGDSSNTRSTVEELVFCLHYLNYASNAPVLEKARATVTILFELLQSSFSLDHAYQAAFATINCVLACTMTEDIELTQQIVKEAVPLIRRYWHTKAMSLKEEMLVTMIYGEFSLSHLSQSDDLQDSSSNLEGLLEAMQIEYGKRPEREQLQIDDLRLVGSFDADETRMPLSTRTFTLRSGVYKAEQAWATLEVIASISYALYDQPHDVPVTEGLAPPQKRLKVAKPVDTLLQHMGLSSVPEKLTALQALSFVMEKMILDVDTVQRTLSRLMAYISGNVPSLANWAMLAASCLAHQEASNAELHQPTWLQIWRLSARNITLVSTCQVACHIMAILLNRRLVEFGGIVDITDSMLSSVDLNGPVLFTESALAWWTAVISSKAKSSPGLVHDTAERVLRWVIVRWNPSKFHNRQALSLLSQHCQAPGIIRLISATLGLPRGVDKYRSTPEFGVISQAKLRCIRHERLIKYLLLKEHMHEDEPSRLGCPGIETMIISLPDSKFTSLCKTMIDFLSAEIAAILQDSPFLKAEEPQLTTVDMIRVCCTVCVVAFALSKSPRFSNVGKVHHLLTLATQLSTQISKYIPAQESSRALSDGLLGSFGVFLGSLNHISSDISLLSHGTKEMALNFGVDFWQRLRTVEGERDMNEDVMELDQSFDSQSTHSRGDTTFSDIPRNEIAAMTDHKAYRASLMAKICLVAMAGPTHNGDSDDYELPIAFVEYLISFPPDQYLATRPFLEELLESEISINKYSGCLMLEHLAQDFLESYDFERCEVVLGVCLNTMTSLTELWTDAEGGDISAVGSQIYSWFGLVLKRGILSSHVHLCMSLMLQRVIKAHPDYAKNLSLPSARTSLFKILEEGNIAVKFQVGLNISEIFGLFVLKEHDAILEDVINSLPNDRMWREGIALRLFVLAHLGSAWSTLLRRCIYAIFETPGHVQGSAEHAKYCLKYVSRRLGLRSPRDLFKLFVSQIIYTWLDSESLDSIPFIIFGYNSLADLLRDVQDEVTGQVLLRGRDDEAKLLAQELAEPFQALLKHSFSKTAAYSIARDVAIPASRDSLASGAEVRLRKRLGSEEYLKLITENFAEILAILYKIVDQEDSIRKGFQKKKTFAVACHAYDEITSAGASTTVLPDNQQPCFKATYLVDEIEFLWNRTSYESDSMWTPALYIYNFRELLGTIHTALGSLHACSVIRKIRILVSMAGETALNGYPLETTLHSLSPFLTDTQCAEDVIGIQRYLLNYGASYLQTVPSFLCGLIVSTLVSMKTFLGTPQDSTTQESQFIATMSKAQQFHTWLGDYGAKYTSSLLSGPAEQSFKAMASSARQLNDTGNARKGTYESELLLELLEDERSGRNLVDRPSKDLILDMLSSNFDVPTNFRDDILGLDAHAVMYAPVVWGTCKNKSRGAGYYAWAARVLGRAYCTSGTVSNDMSKEVDLGSPQNATSALSSDLGSNSMSKILSLLGEILLTENRQDVGIAEIILQRVITRAEGTTFFGECESSLPSSLLTALMWQPFYCPTNRVADAASGTMLETVIVDRKVAFAKWVEDLCIALISKAPDDPLLSELSPILRAVDILPERMLPYIMHLVLLREADGNQTVRRVVSDALEQWFQDTRTAAIVHKRLILHTILYLRTQPLPHEATKADRSRWLEIDYRIAADAAVQCQMFKTALLFLEISFSETAKASRRVSDGNSELPLELLLRIFQHLDDKDSFYGIQQPSSIFSVMERLEHENCGFKSLSFRAAYYDSQIRCLGSSDSATEEGMIRVLDMLDLNGLSQSLLADLNGATTISTETMLRTAQKLERWDIAVPPQEEGEAATIFKVFQGVQDATSLNSMHKTLHDGFSRTISSLLTDTSVGYSAQRVVRALAVLTEIEEVLSARGLMQLEETWTKFESRKEWMLAGSFDNVHNIVSCRETLFSTLSKSNSLQALLNISPRDARRVESRVLLASSALNRRHTALQSGLTSATYLTRLVQPCKDVGVNIDVAVSYEGSNVLWDQGEMSASIRMLQDLLHLSDTRIQDIYVGKPEILAKLGHRISEARLEKPDEIIANYLRPAIQELYSTTEGDEAGQVYHEFAFFCDQQLQNADNLEDYQRIKRLRERKKSEVRELEVMIKSGNSQAREKDNLKAHRTKAKQWFELDDREYQRLRDSRQVFLCQSLENYLLSLKACDTYDSDALRFSTLWLAHSDDDSANMAVAKNISFVGSRKFAPLINQWTSRLLDVPGRFQTLLASLVLRICVDHPYHGMYQIFTSSKSKGGKDEAALARTAAAAKIIGEIKANKRAAPIWQAIHNTNVLFHRFASEKVDDAKAKPGSKVPMRKFPVGLRLEQDALMHRVPPPTMKIRLRADCDYSGTPTIAKFHNEFSIASGISMPKILTVLASDGRKYKQLFKSGNDDLRQDSIMEQVFEQVSNLLQTHRETRQRNLGIRTYKVLPLTATSGIIEFVLDTIPLHDFLIPAHQRHFPGDLKTNACRKSISDVQSKSVETRIKVFRQVMERFHPVMRYFFMERFENPDDWFEKRLAYTRSTAAISILGYVLGLGDRHGHNILLDEKTGEVIHIDLGIAFEQGRVLPVPEVVPFRLTRDLVDGMGITGTKGVFQRCCEFTLEALRNESYTIMTILDVLRYDPLYSWSMSPVRLQKLQKAQDDAQAAAVTTTDADEEAYANKTKENEPGEADRALTVVAKKLSKSLSVTATVNELIQQATDVRNLAVLFCGWAAYA